VHDKIQPSNRHERLGWYMYQSWLRVMTSAIQVWAKQDPMNVAEYHRLNPHRVIEFKICGDEHMNHTKVEFDSGRLLATSEKYASFEGPQAFDSGSLDNACDKWTTKETSVEPRSDPKFNLYFTHTKRKHFQYREKFRDEFLAGCQKASGGAPWKLECDWVANHKLFEKMAPNFIQGDRNKEWPERHYYGFVQGVMWLLENAKLHHAGAIDKINEKIPKHIIFFRPKEEEKWYGMQKCTHFTVEDGMLILQYHPRNFGVNVNVDFLYPILQRDCPGIF